MVPFTASDVIRSRVAAAQIARAEGPSGARRLSVDRVHVPL
jgi:hypothetical protein